MLIWHFGILYFDLGQLKIASAHSSSNDEKLIRFSFSANSFLIWVEELHFSFAVCRFL